MLSYPFHIMEIPFEPSYREKLTEEELNQRILNYLTKVLTLFEIYLIHDCVVKEEYRFLSVHKVFHKLAVEVSNDNDILANSNIYRKR